MESLLTAFGTLMERVAYGVAVRAYRRYPVSHEYHMADHRAIRQWNSGLGFSYPADWTAETPRL